MYRLLPYIAKSLWRHCTLSLLTVSGAAVALLVFCVVGSVQQGLLELTSDSRAGNTLIVFQENRFCPQSSRIPQDYSRQIEKILGVCQVIPIKVFTNNCRASIDAIVFQGTGCHHHTDQGYVSGRHAFGSGRVDWIYPLARLCVRRTGVVSGGYHHSDVSSGSNAEHAVLQTIGFRPFQVFRLVVTESLLLSLLGGILGIGCGLATLWWCGLSIAAEGVTLSFQPSWLLAIQGTIVSMMVGLLAGLAPGWQAARAEIVAALRHA